MADVISMDDNNPKDRAKGMTKEEFTEATKYISAFTISIIEVE